MTAPDNAPPIEAPDAATPDRQGDADTAAQLLSPTGVLLLAAGPLLALTDRLVTALTGAMVLLAMLLLGTPLISALRHRLAAPLRLPLCMLVMAAGASIAGQLLQAWDLALYTQLPLQLQLLAASPLLLAHGELVASRRPPGPALRHALGCALLVLATLTVLAGVRESLGQVLLLAQLAPGAFFALGTALTVLALWQRRRDAVTFATTGPDDVTPARQRRVRVTSRGRSVAAGNDSAENASAGGNNSGGKRAP